MRVMVFGTFDNLHPGHSAYLSQAGAFGTEIIAVIARDANVLKIKGRAAQEDENTRRLKVEKAIKDLGLAGKAVLGSLSDRLQILRDNRPDIICLGYDQKVDLKALRELISAERFFCELKRLKPFFPEKYKSSLNLR